MYSIFMAIENAAGINIVFILGITSTFYLFIYIWDTWVLTFTLYFGV